MLISRIPITRKLSSCVMQDEGLNTSLVSAGLQMAEQKNNIRMCIGSPQLLSGSPGSVTATYICRGLHLQAAAQHPPVSSFLQRRETNSSHCLTFHWVPPLTSVSFLLRFSPLYFSQKIWLFDPRSFGSSTCSIVTAENFSSPSDQADDKAASSVA